jgi:hypothetical protein
VGQEVSEPSSVCPPYLAGAAEIREGAYDIWRLLYLTPNFFIRPRRVLGWRFRIRAAPFCPSINPPVFCRTARI